MSVIHNKFDTNSPMNQVETKMVFVITKSNWSGAHRYLIDLDTSASMIV